MAREVTLPPGVRLAWAGQFEAFEKARAQLLLVVPLTLLLVALLLYMNTGSLVETLLILGLVPFSLIGAVWLLYLLGYNLSIAVWVGVIALAGLDAQNGVVMLLYLQLVHARRTAEGRMRNFADLSEAVVEGAADRIRPKLMTVLTMIVGLTPLLWSTGTGADVMRRIAAPMIGGLVTSFGVELLVYPALYALWKQRSLPRPQAERIAGGTVKHCRAGPRPGRPLPSPCRSPEETTSMTSSRPRLRFGIFLAPFHPVTENPSAAMRRDFELVEWLDELGYDEAWIGEHHSAGMEIIASPEVFIAAAAERTRNIRLGTGVSSLPYHHPLMLADRMMQLDHQTRGRVMLGMGPGSLPSDAFMMGIDPLKQRDMMDEAISVIVPLLRGESVTHEAGWFHAARCAAPAHALHAAAHGDGGGSHHLPGRAAGVRASTASACSPSAPPRQGGFNALAMTHQIRSEKAEEHGQTADRASWRLVGPMHVAETREQARENVRFGIGEWLRYFQEVGALPLAPGGSIEDAIESLTKSGLAVIGTPDDAIAQIQRLEEQSGGFGCFLQLAHNWADFGATKRSYELIARYVMPQFQELNPNRVKSMEWAAKNRPTFIGAVTQAIGNELQKHAREQAAKKAPGQS